MIKIIDGQAYESKLAPYFRLRAVDLGSGHLELSAVRGRTLEEFDMSPLAMQHYLEAVERRRAETVEERARQSLESAAKRAKTRVRRLCKVINADTLLTLTYKANVQDLALCKANLKEFVRRVNRVIPEFRAVCCFERQERGAYHVHMATLRVPKLLNAGKGVKLKSFNVLRSIWRSVTQENGGNVDVAKTRIKSRSQRSPAKIAAYLSKYITKAFADGESGSNRWTKFGNFDVPKAIDLGYFPTMLDVVSAAYTLVDDAHRVVDQNLSRWGDWFCLFVDKPPTSV